MRGYNKHRGTFHKAYKVAFFALFTFCGMMCPFISATSQNTVGVSWNSGEDATADSELDLNESAGDSISYVFSYRNRSGVLELSSNQQALSGIDQLVKRYRRDILSGQGHFAIISYIRPCDLYIPQQLNAASVQASVARAYLKSKHNIEHNNITFAFDTAHYTNYKVRVAYVSAPIAMTDNQDIYYTADKDLGVIVRSTLRYKPLPLMEYDAMRKSLTAYRAEALPKKTVPKKVVSKKALPKEKVVKDIPASEAVDSEPINERAYIYKPDPRLVVVEADKPNYRKRLQPYLAVKSNLLTWAGVIPSEDYRYITPNLELECFLGNRWSINVDGYYTCNDMKNESYEYWAATSVGVEPRFWFNSNARFLGLYTGLYGSYGEFDKKLDKISSEGTTGSIKEGGLSLGCYLPLTSRLGVELGARYGYRMMSYDSYIAKTIAGKTNFYYQASYIKNAPQLTGVRLLISYRFGQSSVHKLR